MLGNVSATSFFGGVDSAADLLGSGSATSLFGSNTAGAAEAALQAVAQSQTREINRIRGYKLQLTPADNQKLGKLQEKILEIQEKAFNGTVRPDEYADREEYYAQANEIIGKQTLSEEAAEEPIMVDLASAMTSLMQRNLDAPTKRRVQTLERLQATIETALTERPGDQILGGRYQTVVNSISALNPLRRVDELSVDERKTYDTLAESINGLAGFKLQLSSKEAIRVAEIEKSLTNLSV